VLFDNVLRFDIATLGAMTQAKSGTKRANSLNAWCLLRMALDRHVRVREGMRVSNLFDACASGDAYSRLRLGLKLEASSREGEQASS
jgi:hypothetical protein